MSTQGDYSDDEWQLLCSLPLYVVGAAVHAEADGTLGTMREAHAGMNLVRAGTDASSPLMQEIMAAAASAAPAAGSQAPAAAPTRAATPSAGGASTAEAISATDRTGRVVAASRDATAVLAAKATPQERAEYTDWLLMIAEEVCGTQRTGGILGVGGEKVSAAERQFLADLTAALGRTA